MDRLWRILIDQAGGKGFVGALGGDDLLQLGLQVVGVEALHALVEMVEHLLAFLVRQLAVEEQLEVADRLLAIFHGSQVLLSAAAGGMKPWASAYSYNDFCIAFLPRCSRDITVPIGMSSISAISL